MKDAVSNKASKYKNRMDFIHETNKTFSILIRGVSGRQPTVFRRQWTVE